MSCLSRKPVTRPLLGRSWQPATCPTHSRLRSSCLVPVYWFCIIFLNFQRQSCRKRRKDTEKSSGSLPGGLQLLELGWSKAVRQQCLPGLPGGCGAERWAVPCSFPGCVSRKLDGKNVQSLNWMHVGCQHHSPVCDRASPNTF